MPILNLQLSSKSVAKTGKAEKDELVDHYVGLIGENKGKISYITLRDPDIQVNVKTETVAADTLPKADQLKLTATKFRHGAGGGRRELARCACCRRTLRRQHRHAGN